MLQLQLHSSYNYSVVAAIVASFVFCSVTQPLLSQKHFDEGCVKCVLKLKEIKGEKLDARNSATQIWLHALRYECEDFSYELRMSRLQRDGCRGNADIASGSGFWSCGPWALGELKVWAGRRRGHLLDGG